MFHNNCMTGISFYCIEIHKMQVYFIVLTSRLEEKRKKKNITPVLLSDYMTYVQWKNQMKELWEVSPQTQPVSPLDDFTLQLCINLYEPLTSNWPASNKSKHDNNNWINIKNKNQ